MAFFFKKLANRITRPKNEVEEILQTSLGEPQNFTVPTRHGEISIFVYKPENGNNLKGVYLNLHGGGYIMQHARQDDHLCKYLAENLDCIVVNPEYDTAPHHPFPIPADQCYDVYRWILENVKKLDGDISKLAIGGQSAGAAMSLGICMRAKQDKLQTPQILVLNYPPLDLSIDPYLKNSSIPKPLVSPAFEEMVQLYYLKNEKNKMNPLASPAFFSDLSRLPKTILIAAEHDSLLKENQDFAIRLKEEVKGHIYKEVSNADHFYTHAGPAEKAKECMDIMIENLTPIYRPVNSNLT